MKLSEVPPHVKRLLLAEHAGEWDQHTAEQLTLDEVLFLVFYGAGYASVTARLDLLYLHHVANAREVLREHPWDWEPLEQDEPLPPAQRDPRLASHRDADDCAGWREYMRVQAYGDRRKVPREELLRARYEDVFEREIDMGFPVPKFATWARKQSVGRRARKTA